MGADACINGSAIVSNVPVCLLQLRHIAADRPPPGQANTRVSSAWKKLLRPFVELAE